MVLCIMGSGHGMWQFGLDNEIEVIQLDCNWTATLPQSTKADMHSSNWSAGFTSPPSRISHPCNTQVATRTWCLTAGKLPWLQLPRHPEGCRVPTTAVQTNRRGRRAPPPTCRSMQCWRIPWRCMAAHRHTEMAMMCHIGICTCGVVP